MAWRRGPRRMTDYSTDMNEEYAEDIPKAEQEKSTRFKPESAQSEKPGNDQDIMLMLEKINLQLENMRLSEQNQQQGQDQAKAGQSKDTGLEKLVKELMQNNNPNQSSISDKSQDKGQKTDTADALLSQLIKQTSGKSSPQNQEAKSPKSNSETVVLQTAAEVLSRAQYELSNELENSLKKLKQVISESEQIATKISNLIEQKQQ